MAQKISSAFENKGYNLSAETETNQIFAVLPNSLIEELSKDFAFYVWQKKDNDLSVVRMVTSWATVEEKVDELIASI